MDPLPLGPYRCGICLEFFSGYLDLRAHKKSVHSAWFERQKLPARPIPPIPPIPENPPIPPNPPIPENLSIPPNPEMSTPTRAQGPRVHSSIAAALKANKIQLPEIANIRVRLNQNQNQGNSGSINQNRVRVTSTADTLQRISLPSSPSSFPRDFSSGDNSSTKQSVIPQKQKEFKTQSTPGEEPEPAMPKLSPQLITQIPTENYKELDSTKINASTSKTPTCTGTAEHECPICGKILYNKFNLMCHVRIHTGDRAYKCKSCPRRYFSYKTMIIHSRKGKCSGDGNSKAGYSNSQTSKGVSSRIEDNNQCKRNERKKTQTIYLENSSELVKPGQLTRTMSEDTEDEVEGDDDEDYIPGSEIRTCLSRKRIRFSKLRTRASKFKRKLKYRPENFECPHCGRICSRQGTLDDHIRSQHTGEKPFVCQYCETGFHSKRSLLSHQMSYQGTCQEKCMPHNQGYSHEVPEVDPKTSIESAVATRTEISIQTDEIRTDPNPNQTKLVRASTLGSNTNKFGPRTKISQTGSLNCPFPDCNKLMSKRSALLGHIRLHTGEKPFRCSICMERFHYKLYLDRHLKSKKCSPGGIYSTLTVENSASPPNRRTINTSAHIKPTAIIEPNQVRAKGPSSAHASETNQFVPRLRTPSSDLSTPVPHVCPHCEKILSSESALEDHIRLHTGEKPFSCPKCRKRFYSRKTLTAHRRSAASRCWQPKNERSRQKFTKRKIGTDVKANLDTSRRTLMNRKLKALIPNQNEIEKEEEFENGRKILLRPRGLEFRSKYAEPLSEGEEIEHVYTFLFSNEIKDKNSDSARVHNQKKTPVKSQNVAKVVPTARASASTSTIAIADVHMPSTSAFAQTHAHGPRPCTSKNAPGSKIFTCNLCGVPFHLHAELLEHQLGFHRVSNSQAWQ